MGFSVTLDLTNYQTTHNTNMSDHSGSPTDAAAGAASAAADNPSDTVIMFGQNYTVPTDRKLIGRIENKSLVSPQLNEVALQVNGVVITTGEILKAAQTQQAQQDGVVYGRGNLQNLMVTFNADGEYRFSADVEGEGLCQVVGRVMRCRPQPGRELRELNLPATSPDAKKDA